MTKTKTATHAQTVSEVADRNANSIAQHQALKAEVSKCSKAIHGLGGEQAVWDALGGGMTVLALCDRLGVSASAMDRWVQRGGEARREAYARSRTRGAQSLAEETIAISDAATPQDVQVAKLRIDTRWRMAAKTDAEQFGDRQTPLVNIDLGSLALDALRLREVVKPVHGLADDDDLG
jgi:transposase-like protein